MKVLAAEQDWEIVDDDGFIYKRARREEAVSIAVDPPAEEDEEEEEAAEEEETVERRKELLLRKKEMYATELRRWEELLQKQEEMCSAAAPPALLPVTESPVVLPHYEPYDELVHQVQELEFFIRKYSSVCDQAEDMCMLLDEELKNHNLQLPTPRQIFQQTTSS